MRHPLTQGWPHVPACCVQDAWHLSGEVCSAEEDGTAVEPPSDRRTVEITRLLCTSRQPQLRRPSIGPDGAALTCDHITYYCCLFASGTLVRWTLAAGILKCKSLEGLCTHEMQNILSSDGVVQQRLRK